MPLINMLFKGGVVFILNPRENLFPGLPVSRGLRWEQVSQLAGDLPTWVLPKQTLWLITCFIVLFLLLEDLVPRAYRLMKRMINSAGGGSV